MKQLWWALCALLMTVSVQTSAEPAYGKSLLRSQDLSADTIARFVRVTQAKAIGAKPSPDDEREWIGESIPLASSGSPYTVVVRMSGTAMSDGELSVGWSGGWSKEDTNSLLPLIGAPSNAKAGERVNLVAISMPVTFKEDVAMPTALRLVGAKNIRLDAVRFEVWSGEAETNLLETVWSWTPLMAGLLVLGLSFWLRRR